ncbi:MAG: NAD(P)H-hydrate dehydratase [Oscillospiraceae bacterium]|nr:NAD(P)H-hydrate dehydratase [Oscillospiraceae bacterium]
MKKLSPEEYAGMFSDDCAQPEGKGTVYLSEREDFLLPRRKTKTHKYSYGRALLIAGSTGFSGAPVLAANACERSGAGLTRLIVPESIYVIAASRCDGAVVQPAPADESGRMTDKALDSILPHLSRADACAIGPGLGTGEAAAAIVEAVLRQASCPVVLDADALTVCGTRLSLLSLCRAPVILTPHEGEFRRLGGDLSSGRPAGALAFTEAHKNTILILKGFGTLISSGAEITVNPTGSPALAKGGSGDVLCGLLCALLAQGFDPFFSARCAVWLHGLAGDLASAENGEYSVTPSDLIRFLPRAFRSLCHNP